ncbi:MAG: ABC transporter permease [Verrucomicrobiales bacterium]
MTPPFSLFLALRYIRPRRSIVSAVSVLAAVGVMLCVGAMTVVIAVMVGFESKIKEIVLGMEPHIYAYPQQAGMPLDPTGEEVLWEDVADRLRSAPGIRSVSPMVEDTVFVESSSEPVPGMMRAIDLATDPKAAEIRRLVEEEGIGEFDLKGSKAVIGSDLARRIQRDFQVGDTITLYSPNNIREIVRAVRDLQEDEDRKDDQEEWRAINKLVLPIDLEVTGVFDSIQYGNYLFVPLHIGQEIFELKDEVGGLAVELDEPYKAVEVRNAAVFPALPDGWAAPTWTEQRAQFFETIRNERIMMYVVMGVVFLAAAFGIMAVVLTVAIQKRHEIGVLRALGARLRQIIGGFLGLGMGIGLVGVPLGFLAAKLILDQRNNLQKYLKKVGIDLFPPEALRSVPEIPAKIQGSDLLIIGGIAFVLASIAGLSPTFSRARVDPAKALRDQ